MIAENNDIFTSATQSLYEFNADKLIREQCQAREDYEKHERTQLMKLAAQEATIEKLSNENNLLRAELERLRKQLDL